jgi:hypothetical protein
MRWLKDLMDFFFGRIREGFLYGCCIHKPKWYEHWRPFYRSLLLVRKFIYALKDAFLGHPVFHAGNIGRFDKFKIPSIGRAFPSISAHDICSVQPMTVEPTVHFWRKTTTDSLEGIHYEASGT